jgi:RimJ/RimL family protein N-acetyltransferase
VNWGFESLGLRCITAVVFGPNQASARVLEKCGFSFEGRETARYFRDGQFIDGLRFAKISLPD